MAVGLNLGCAAAAAGGFCWACAKPGVAMARAAAAQSAGTRSAWVYRRNVMVVLPLKPDLWPFDHTGAGGSSQNSGLRHPDEQAVLDHAWNLRQFRGQSGRIGDPFQPGVKDPVPAARDE